MSQMTCKVFQWSFAKKKQTNKQTKQNKSKNKKTKTKQKGAYTFKAEFQIDVKPFKKHTK